MTTQKTNHTDIDNDIVNAKIISINKMIVTTFTNNLNKSMPANIRIGYEDVDTDSCKIVIKHNNTTAFKKTTAISELPANLALYQEKAAIISEFFQKTESLGFSDSYDEHIYPNFIALDISDDKIKCYYYFNNNILVPLFNDYTPNEDLIYQLTEFKNIALFLRPFNCTLFYDPEEANYIFSILVDSNSNNDEKDCLAFYSYEGPLADIKYITPLMPSKAKKVKDLYDKIKECGYNLKININSHVELVNKADATFDSINYNKLFSSEKAKRLIKSAQRFSKLEADLDASGISLGKQSSDKTTLLYKKKIPIANVKFENYTEFETKVLPVFHQFSDLIRLIDDNHCSIDGNEKQLSLYYDNVCFVSFPCNPIITKKNEIIAQMNRLTKIIAPFEDLGFSIRPFKKKSALYYDTIAIKDLPQKNLLKFLKQNKHELIKDCSDFISLTAPIRDLGCDLSCEEYDYGAYGFISHNDIPFYCISLNNIYCYKSCYYDNIGIENAPTLDIDDIVNKCHQFLDLKSQVEAAGFKFQKKEEPLTNYGESDKYPIILKYDHKQIGIAYNDHLYGCLIEDFIIDKDRILSMIKTIPNFDPQATLQFNYVRKGIIDTVDLGLPSGTKWFTCNSGARRTFDNGYLFNNSLEPNIFPFKEPTLKFFRLDRDDLVEEDLHPDSNLKVQIPSVDDFKELIENCTHIYVAPREPINAGGLLFVSKINGNSIFLPTSCHACEFYTSLIDDPGELHLVNKYVEYYAADRELMYINNLNDHIFFSDLGSDEQLLYIRLVQK